MIFAKKLCTAVLAAALGLGMGAAALADQPALPDAARDGSSSITVHKYAVDSMGKLVKRADGTELDDNYVLYEMEGGEEMTLGKLTPLPGIPFRITRVQDGATEVDKAEPITGEGKYSREESTGAGGIILFDQLSFGVYLVEELATGDVATAMPPFLVSVPLTHPEGKGWLYDIHVYPKNILEDGPEIDKNIWDGEGLAASDTVSVGDTVTWQIDVDVPPGIATGKKFTVTDVIDSRLTFGGNLSVYYTDTAGGKVVLTGDTEYRLTAPQAENGMTLTVDFPDEAMRRKLAQALAGDGQGKPTLTIRYDTVVNETARAEGNMGEKIPNQAKLDYTNASDVDYGPESPEPEVHTGGVLIYKYDGNDASKKMPGAKFKIYPSRDAALAGSVAIKAPGGSGDEWEVTTDGDGYARFYGLAYGKYWIVETEAPTGYNLLTEPVEVTVSGTSHLAAGPVRVENRAGFTLPITGGSGTVAMTIIGACLVCGAGILLFVAARRRG